MLDKVIKVVGVIIHEIVEVGLTVILPIWVVIEVGRFLLHG